MDRNTNCNNRTSATNFPISHRVPTVASLTGIPETKIWQAIRDGQLAAKKIGRTTVVEDAEARRFVSGLPNRAPNPQ
jgi:hypothetical protein